MPLNSDEWRVATSNGRDEVSPNGGVEAVQDGRSEFVIIDNRPFFRHCLASAVHQTLGECIIHCYARTKDWLTNLPDMSKVCVVLLNSPDDDVFDEDIALLRATAFAPPVILISDNVDPNRILGAFEKGVRGYIPTSISFEVAVEAIRLVRAGGAYVPASSLMVMQQAFENPPPAVADDRASGFTSRQTAVLRALREGKANKIIAYELNMRESTVKVHVRNIMRKLNARNRTEVTFKTMGLFLTEKSAGSR